jgi:Acetyltransferase (GNAT) domain
MGHVRAFTSQDIPQVADLHRTVFRSGGREAADAEAYTRYFSSVFLDNPWRDERVCSRVFEEDDGRISGFLGVVPRRLSMDGRPLLAAICSQFVVHPERRGLVGLQLLKAVFEGPQDVSISDEANDATRRIWEGRGGMTAFLHSLRWLRPLRPGRLAASWLREHRWQAPFRAAAALGEALAAPLLGPRVRPPAPDCRGERLDEATLLSCLTDVGDEGFLRPAYDVRSLKWLLGRAALSTREGQLEGIAVRNDRGELLGFYLYHAKADGVGEVLHVAATRETIGRVLGHLADHAWRHGAIGLAGRLHPGFLDELLTGCFVSRGPGPWMLVHSKRPSLVDAILRGDTSLSRLDGEWCLRFSC